jgi:septal ring factor EnvC (AmiA/AmiB activator)
MALADADLQQIKRHFSAWLVEANLEARPSQFDLQVQERVARIEQGMDHQLELMRNGFALVETRFEQVDKRFEQVDKRFEQVDKRFDQIDKRFEQIDQRLGANDDRFDYLTQRIDRFMAWSMGTTITLSGVIITLLV